MSPEEFIKWWSDLCKKAAKNPKVPEVVKDYEKIIQFRFTDFPEGNCYIDTHGGKAVYHEGTHENPDFAQVGETKAFEKLVKGTLGETEAFLKRKIKIEGSMRTALKARGVFDLVKEEYKKSLE